MRFVRFGAAGEERAGVLDGAGRVRDLSGIFADVTPATIPLLGRLTVAEIEDLPLAPPDTRVGPCVGGAGKFICVGLNYADHAAEAGMALPSEPILFMKATSAIAGPDDDVVIPPGSDKTDWEVELGLVIGREARDLRTDDEAAAAIAGYCVVNDLSERAWQLERGGQWVKGKSSDGFGPIGPWLVTPDEIADIGALGMWLEVDGRTYQRGSTATMVFKPAFLVRYVSRFMSLQPGDIISTGTPPGVGMGQTPPVFLRPGQTMRLGIDGLGEQRQRTVAAAEAG